MPDDDILSVEEALNTPLGIALAPDDLVKIHCDTGTIARCDSEGIWYLVVEDLEVRLSSVIEQLQGLETILEAMRDKAIEG